MDHNIILPNRRVFLAHGLALAGGVGFANSLFAEPGKFADFLQTPHQTEGPFYPDKLPLDTDNDLIVINDSLTPSVGTITHLTGRVMDLKGNPIRNARVDLWQCDGKGVYLHSRGGDRNKMDKNFQGFGRFTTNRKGEYYFRTIKPVPYPGRTPHIHVKVFIGGKKQLTTQLYIKGHDMNQRDGLFNGVLNKQQRDSLLVDFKPIKGSAIGELEANFDIVLGMTPEDKKHS